MEHKTLNDVCIINPSKTLPIHQETQISFLPMEAVSTDGVINLSKTIPAGRCKNFSIFQNGDVIFAKITPCMENGKCAVVHSLSNGYGAGSTEFIVLRPNPQKIISKFLYYFIHQEKFRLNCRQNMTGSAGQKRVPVKYLGKCEIPVPPLPEQERIVAKIEELFSQLDAAVAELTTIKKKLQIYRQAVLKEAFEQYESVDQELKYFIEQPRYGTSKKCSYHSGNQYIAVYRIPNIDYHNGKIDHADIKCAEFSKEELDTLRLQDGDILLIRSNGSLSLVGRAAQITDADTNGVFAGYLIRVRVKDKKLLNPKYLLYAFSTHEVRSYIERTAKSTSGVNNINSNEIKKIKIPICLPENQQLVVDKIEATLPCCDAILRDVEMNLQHAAALRQSILKQAFEGNL